MYSYQYNFSTFKKKLNKKSIILRNKPRQTDYTVNTTVYSLSFDESSKMFSIPAIEQIDRYNMEGLPANRRETNQYKRSDRNIVTQIGSRRSRIYMTQQWRTDAWKS